MSSSGSALSQADPIGAPSHLPIPVSEFKVEAMPSHAERGQGAAAKALWSTGCNGGLIRIRRHANICGFVHCWREPRDEGEEAAPSRVGTSGALGQLPVHEVDAEELPDDVPALRVAQPERPKHLRCVERKQSLWSRGCGGASFSCS